MGGAMIPLLMAVLVSGASGGASGAGSYYTAKEAHQLFAQANAAYASGKKEDAEADLQKLLEHGFGGPDVLYNLGTVELSEGKLGPATLHLEQAKREGGAQADLDANLALARAKQLDKVIGARADGGMSPRMLLALPGRGLGWIFLAAWVLGFLSLVAFRFRPAGKRGGIAALASVSLVVAVCAGGLWGGRIWVKSHFARGVVLAKTVPARELPSESAHVAFEVHEGLDVRLLERAQGYVRIQLPNGLEGWAKSDSIAPI